MISGSVIALGDPAVTGRPSISVTVASTSDEQLSVSVSVAVDTGFTGFLTLRSSTIYQLGLPFITNQSAELADGSISHYDVYAGRIFWHGQERLIPIYSVDSDPLVGVAMLWNSRLTMDIVPNGRVSIIPLMP